MLARGQFVGFAVFPDLVDRAAVREPGLFPGSRRGRLLLPLAAPPPHDTDQHRHQHDAHGERPEDQQALGRGEHCPFRIHGTHAYRVPGVVRMNRVALVRRKAAGS